METNLVEWSGELSVGVSEIDTQHQKLVLLLNELHRAIREHHGSEASRRILGDLAEYTRVHFATEESLMRISGYPGFEAHKQVHEDLIRQVVELQQKVDAGQASISFELLHFLRNWLLHHIAGADKAFGLYFSHSSEAARWLPPAAIPREVRRPWWRFW